LFFVFSYALRAVSVLINLGVHVIIFKMSYWSDISDDVFFHIPLYKKGKTYYGQYVQQRINNYIQSKKRWKEKKRERRLNWIEIYLRVLTDSYKNIRIPRRDYCRFLRKCKLIIRRMRIRFENIDEYECRNLSQLKRRRRYINLSDDEFIRLRATLLYRALRTKLFREWAKFSNPSWFD